MSIDTPDTQATATEADEIDTSDYTTISDDPFFTWPMASPTSRFGINVRYYAIDQGDTLARYRIDVGTDTEHLLEQMYLDFNLRSRGVSPRAFEETIRAFIQHRLASAGNYAMATALYIALTSDPREAYRITRREQKVMDSQARRFPYTTHEVYRKEPMTFWGRIRWTIGYWRARLFH